jgi:hypothetical protein
VTLRRAGVLICATVAIYFFYAPWNYVLLGILLLRQKSKAKPRAASVKLPRKALE